MYAIIDIETTGGRPEIDRITEIAVIIHDGKAITDSFSTLVNPECFIPYRISMLTGITNDMVRNAPKFYEIANKVLAITEQNIFVAHNVRFDYGFVKAAFKNLGYNFNTKTLCTVRLSRKAFTGLPSYSLGKLCKSLNINIENRHRALGDAQATAVLFDRILLENNSLLEEQWMAEEQKLTAIPPLLEKSIYDNLPERKTGVYYFYNQQHEVIYTGKANDIKKRISQHFSLSNKSSRLGMNLKSEIADISFTETGSELIALLLESDEIKKLKPKYNVAQKRGRANPFYGIFHTTDKDGYINLFVRRLKPGDEPLTTSDILENAKGFLYRQLEKYNLCLAKCDLHKTGGYCFNFHIHKCNGACGKAESVDDYNKRAKKAIRNFSFQSECFFIVSSGRKDEERSVVCIENGEYKGFGFIDIEFGEPTVDDMRSCIKRYAHNRDIQNILCNGLKQKKYLKMKYDLSVATHF